MKAICSIYYLVAMSAGIFLQLKQNPKIKVKKDKNYRFRETCDQLGSGEDGCFLSAKRFLKYFLNVIMAYWAARIPMYF